MLKPELKEKLDFIQKLKETYKKELEKNTRDILREAAIWVMEKHPELPYICWMQFTPNYNDGEPCEFSLTETQYYSYREDEDFDEEECEKINALITKETLKSLRDFDGILDQLIDGLEETFGGDQKIKIYKDGTIEVFSYECY